MASAWILIRPSAAKVFVCYNKSMANLNTKTLLKSKRREILAIAKQHGVVSIRVFGSVARGEERAGSDIDFIVEVGPTHSAWFPAGLQRDLETF
jgi:predicted nucleotidyltransferase